MNRTQIYLSETQQRSLAELAKYRGTTASALIRDAIDAFLVAQRSPADRIAALRAFALTIPLSDEPSDSVAIVENLRAAGAARLNSLG